MKPSVEGALLLAVLGWSNLSVAQSTFWDRVKDPRAARARSLLRLAERERMAIEPEYESPEASARLSQKAAVMIELAGGTELNDSELSYFFGDCLVSAGPPHDERGQEVLRRVIAENPDAPFVADAWARVGIAAKRSGDTALEIEAYSRALETEWHYRGELFLPRVQAQMVLGNLAEALSDFRSALEVNPDPAVRALAQWALAVALDRSFDVPAALPHARAASQVRFGSAGTLSALELPWFSLQPSYEVHYYRALAQLARARQSVDEPDYVGALQASQLLWLSYIKAAPKDDRWLGRARRHLEQIRSEVNELLRDESEPDETR